MVNGSRLLRDMLVRVFQKLPDFEVVAVLQSLDGLDSLLLSTEIDWLVISTVSDDGISRRVRAIHARYPDMSVLAIAADGSEVLVNRSRTEAVHMEAAALPELIALMRESARSAI